MILPLLLFLLPTNNASAAVIDLVAGQEATNLTNGDKTFLITDNDLSTGYKPILFEFDLIIDFNTVVSRDSVIEYEASFFTTSMGPTNSYFTFLDMNGAEVGSYTLERNAVIQLPSNLNTSIKSIKFHIKKSSTGNADIRDFKLYYDDSQNTHVPLNYEPVENLTYLENYNYVDLFWDNPKEIGFAGNIIKIDGVEVARLNDTAVSYTATGLKHSTPYAFEVISFYSDAVQSASQLITAATTAVPIDTTPPGDITNLTFSASSDAFQMTWVNPTDLDFDHVRMYRNNQLIESNWTADSYGDSGLIPNTVYTYRIVAVDASGNQSTGHSQSMKTSTHVNTTPPVSPFNVAVTDGNSSGRITWSRNPEPDVAGYNLYVDGVQYNTALILSTNHVLSNLINGQTYDISVSAVNTSGFESALSPAVFLMPTAGSVPIFQSMYDLKDVADGTNVWFSALWPIMAFAVGIIIAFIVSNRIKSLILN